MRQRKAQKLKEKQVVRHFNNSRKISRQQKDFYAGHGSRSPGQSGLLTQQSEDIYGQGRSGETHTGTSLDKKKKRVQNIHVNAIRSQ